MHTKRTSRFKKHIDEINERLDRMIDAYEPIFTLRAKDALFLPTLRFWIDQAKAGGLHADRLEDAEECYQEAVIFRSDL